MVITTAFDLRLRSWEYSYESVGFFETRELANKVSADRHNGLGAICEVSLIRLENGKYLRLSETYEHELLCTEEDVLALQKQKSIDVALSKLSEEDKKVLGLM